MKMRMNLVVIVILVICAAVYYLNHHKIEGKLDIKGDQGNKSHMSMKIDQSKHNDNN